MTATTVLTMMLSMLALTHMPTPADAAWPSQKQLLAACKAKFGMGGNQRQRQEERPDRLPGRAGPRGDA